MGGAAGREVVVVSARWIARIVAVLILLAFIILMANLQTKLVKMQRSQPRPAPTSTR